MSEMLMTEANQTNEGDTQQPVDAQTEATTDTEQQAEGVQDQQVSDETPVESETSESDAPEGNTSSAIRWLTHQMNSTPKS